MKAILRITPLIVLCVMLVSCEKPIEGELTLLIEQKSAYSPCWAHDGSCVYFVSSTNDLDAWGAGLVWSVDVGNNHINQVSGDALAEMDFSTDGSLCVTYYNGWIRMYDTETWAQCDSTALTEDAKKSLNIMHPPKFSTESNDIIYYHYYDRTSDHSYLHKVNLNDSTDETILSTDQASYVAPGPGDTIVAFGDTIYNLNTQERIFIDISEEYIQSADWNPIEPTELLISSGPQEDILIFNLITKEAHTLGIHKTVKSGWVGGAQYSPDGKKVVFVGMDQDATWSLARIWIFEAAE